MQWLGLVSEKLIFSQCCLKSSGNRSCNELLCHEHYLEYLMVSHFILHLVATIDISSHDFVSWETSNISGSEGWSFSQRGSMLFFEPQKFLD